jgi:6-pyruvoyltetrahydropterin/6-carboxytetrahydropterin synthase
MYVITKEFKFEASHQLEGLRAGHKCMRLHGHSYRVQLLLAAEKLDEHGFVVDYGDLDEFKTFIDNTLDHRHLNDVLTPPRPTTAENIAQFLYEWSKRRWPQLMKVKVSETANTWASYAEE